jgi:8-oxo-dGTP pyrophosphatase MutT (NUDIX family)
MEREMRKRPSSRLLIVDRNQRVLLFRYLHKKGPLAGQDFWSTPGGGVEDGETFQQAAIRELKEETGITREFVGEPVAERAFVMQMPDGEFVESEEQYFLVISDVAVSSSAGWTDQEAEVIADHRWWSKEELTHTTAVVWPENLLEMLDRARQ